MSDKITLQGSYRYSAKVDPTDRDSAWHTAEVGVAIETTDIPTDRDGFLKALVDEAKIQVFTQLNVEFDDNLNPVQVVTNVPVGQTPARKASRARTKNSEGDVDLTSLPRITFQGATWIDYRPAKKAEQVKARYPDFKTEDFKRSEWLEGKDGEDTEFKHQLEAAGLL